MPRITLGFTDRWNLRATMIFEREHHPNLRMSLAEKRDLLRTKRALCVWMYDVRRRALVGETYAVPASAATGEEEDEGTRDVEPFAGQRALYVYSTTILRRYQGRGYGRILKAYLLGRAVEAGYATVIGHARQGASVALSESFGGVVRRRRSNWQGSGETFSFYVLRLGRRRKG
jgi:GNAT superfamily N-acetyltransferase